LKSINEKNKKKYDLQTKNIEITVGDKVLLRNEVGHKIDFKYTRPYNVEKIEERDNIKKKNNKNKQYIKID